MQIKITFWRYDYDGKTEGDEGTAQIRTGKRRPVLSVPTVDTKHAMISLKRALKEKKTIEDMRSSAVFPPRAKSKR